MKNSDSDLNLVTLDQLPEFAKKFSENLKSGDIVSLTGNLGSGKTTFLCLLMTVLGMPLEQGFSSPTFTLLNQYHVKNWLVNHVDLYRLNQFSEFKTLDIMHYFSVPNALTFIEWGDKFSELKKIFTTNVHFEYTKKPNERRIIVKQKKRCHSHIHPWIEDFRQ